MINIVHVNVDPILWIASATRGDRHHHSASASADSLQLCALMPRVTSLLSGIFQDLFRTVTFVEDLGVAARVGGDPKPGVEPRQLADFLAHGRSHPAQGDTARLSRLPIFAVREHYLDIMHGPRHAIDGCRRGKETRCI